MDLVASVEVPVSVEKLFDYVADLANYSSWLEFVHKVELVGDSIETDATWLVELRAKLGVLARSKRLRTCHKNGSRWTTSTSEASR